MQFCETNFNTIAKKYIQSQEEERIHNRKANQTHQSGTTSHPSLSLPSPSPLSSTLAKRNAECTAALIDIDTITDAGDPILDLKKAPIIHPATNSPKNKILRSLDRFLKCQSFSSRAKSTQAAVAIAVVISGIFHARAAAICAPLWPASKARAMRVQNPRS